MQDAARSLKANNPSFPTRRATIGFSQWDPSSSNPEGCFFNDDSWSGKTPYSPRHQGERNPPSSIRNGFFALCMFSRHFLPCTPTAVGISISEPCLCGKDEPTKQKMCYPGNECTLDADGQGRCSVVSCENTDGTQKIARSICTCGAARRHCSERVADEPRQRGAHARGPAQT